MAASRFARGLSRPSREDAVPDWCRDVRYGEIMAVIDAAVGAGVEKVGIVTDGMRREAAGGN